MTLLLSFSGKLDRTALQLGLGHTPLRTAQQLSINYCLYSKARATKCAHFLRCLACIPSPNSNPPADSNPDVALLLCELRPHLHGPLQLITVTCPMCPTAGASGDVKRRRVCFCADAAFMVAALEPRPSPGEALQGSVSLLAQATRDPLLRPGCPQQRRPESSQDSSQLQAGPGDRFELTSARLLQQNFTRTAMLLSRVCCLNKRSSLPGRYCLRQWNG